MFHAIEKNVTFALYRRKLRDRLPTNCKGKIKIV